MIVRVARLAYCFKHEVENRSQKTEDRSQKRDDCERESGEDSVGRRAKSEKEKG